MLGALWGTSSTTALPFSDPASQLDPEAPLFGPLTQQDLEWTCAGGFVTETQVFLRNDCKGSNHNVSSDTFGSRVRNNVVSIRIETRVFLLTLLRTDSGIPKFNSPLDSMILPIPINPPVLGSLSMLPISLLPLLTFLPVPNWINVQLNPISLPSLSIPLNPILTIFKVNTMMKLMSILPWKGYLLYPVGNWVRDLEGG